MSAVRSKLLRDAQAIYREAVRSVLPDSMVKRAVKVDGNTMTVDGCSYKLNKNCYLVGFGKAVYGMAVEMENLLQDHLVRGIISIPHGFSSSQQLTRVDVVRGAENNIPDENAYTAAQKIVELASGLNEEHILIALITGGGSALLPYPAAPVSLADKSALTRLLSKSGATIWEMNSVRKQLSLVKGGGLARLAHPAKVVSLILSDIVGDPLDLIASGPTVYNNDPDNAGWTILQKYGLTDKISPSILQRLQEYKNGSNEFVRSCQNVLVGSNKIALDAAKRAAENLGYFTVQLTDRMEGEAREIGQYYADLVSSKQINNSQYISPSLLKSFQDSSHRNVCAIAGGEPTVTVTGNGRGGRNLELALACAIRLQNSEVFRNVAVLSAGSDGIDGPTDVAGAVACNGQLSENNVLQAETSLSNNDSYNFFSTLDDSQHFVKPGHTGTNVMDIHILLRSDDM